MIRSHTVQLHRQTFHFLKSLEIFKILLVLTKNVRNFSKKCPGSQIPGSCLLEALQVCRLYICFGFYFPSVPVLITDWSSSLFWFLRSFNQLDWTTLVRQPLTTENQTMKTMHNTCKFMQEYLIHCPVAQSSRLDGLTSRIMNFLNIYLKLFWVRCPFTPQPSRLGIQVLK